MSILYIGNKLSQYGYSPSGVETLSEKLGEFLPVRSISNKKSKIFRIADMIWSMIRNINTYEIVLIDTFSGRAFYYAIICSLLSIAFKKKYILILRGGDLPRIIRLKRTISTLIFNFSHYNIVPSLYLKNHCNSINVKSKYIPNFIEIKKYRFKKRNLCEPLLLWVRSFHEAYNPQMAIFVLKELKKTYPTAKLCMVGPDKDGSLNVCNRLAIELGLEESVKFTGFLDKSKWIDLSEDYDIFINTTNFDNQPVSVTEIMSLGLPIVSTNAGGLKYFHKDGWDALIVKKNDVQAMVEKITIILNEPKIVTRLTINARTKAESFDWDLIKRSWQHILK